MATQRTLALRNAAESVTLSACEVGAIAAGDVRQQRLAQMLIARQAHQLLADLEARAGALPFNLWMAKLNLDVEIRAYESQVAA